MRALKKWQAIVLVGLIVIVAIIITPATRTNPDILQNVKDTNRIYVADIETELYRQKYAPDFDTAIQYIDVDTRITLYSIQAYRDALQKEIDTLSPSTSDKIRARIEVLNDLSQDVTIYKIDVDARDTTKAKKDYDKIITDIDAFNKILDETQTTVKQSQHSDKLEYGVLFGVSTVLSVTTFVWAITTKKSHKVVRRMRLQLARLTLLPFLIASSTLLAFLDSTKTGNSYIFFFGLYAVGIARFVRGVILYRIHSLSLKSQQKADAPKTI